MYNTSWVEKGTEEAVHHGNPPAESKLEAGSTEGPENWRLCWVHIYKTKTKQQSPVEEHAVFKTVSGESVTIRHLKYAVKSNCQSDKNIWHKQLHGRDCWRFSRRTMCLVLITFKGYVTTMDRSKFTLLFWIIELLLSTQSDAKLALWLNHRSLQLYLRLCLSDHLEQLLPSSHFTSPPGCVVFLFILCSLLEEVNN